MKIQNALVSNIFDRSRYFAHVMTVTLPWRMQNIVVMGRVYFTRVFWIFMEFDRNMLSGTGAWCAQLQLMDLLWNSLRRLTFGGWCSAEFLPFPGVWLVEQFSRIWLIWSDLAQMWWVNSCGTRTDFIDCWCSSSEYTFFPELRLNEQFPCIYTRTTDRVEHKFGEQTYFRTPQVWSIFGTCSNKFPPFPGVWFVDQFHLFEESGILDWP